MRKTIYLLSFCIFSTFPISLNAQWAKTNGLPGGTTTQLMPFGDTVLASVGAELYYSMNHGKTWSPILNPDFNRINLVSAEGQNMFGYAYKLSEQTYHWFRTDDFFQSIHLITPDTFGLHDFFLAHGYIYGSVYHNPTNKLCRTQDDGATWEYVSATSLTEAQFDGEHITGVSYPYILQSEDGGFTWDTLLHISSNVSGLIRDENRLFVLLAYPFPGCHASDDYGQTWSYYPSNTLYNFYKYVWHNESIFGLYGKKMIKSSNFGQTWESVQIPLNSYYPAYYGVSSGNALIIGGYQSLKSPGLHRSTDNGNTWNPVSFGITSSSGKLRKYGQDMFVPSPGGLYKAASDDVNWAKIDLDIPQPRTISDFVKTGSHWVLSDGQGIWVSQNQGNTWSKSSVPPGQLNLPTDVMYLENVLNKVIAHGPWAGYDAYYYYISDDNGLNFHVIESLFEQKQTKIKLLEVVGDKVYALGYDMKIYRSDDACTSWVLQSDNLQTSGCGLPSPDVFSSSLQVSGSVIVVTDHDTKIQFSNDAGQSWTCYDLETTDAPWGNGIVTELLRVGNRLLAATQKGIYLSENNGTDWTDWHHGLLHDNITDIEVHNGHLWAATAGSGIWKRPLNQLLAAPAADRYFGEGNHTSPPASADQLLLTPNPAKHQVRVETSGQRGELILQDATGRILVHQSIENTNVDFSVEGLPNGLYQVIFVGEKTVLHGSLVVQR